MTLCRVTGNVVSSAKHPVLAGHKLLVCVPLDPFSGRERGGRLVALDTVQAGVGDTVLVIDEGNAARRILADSRAPVRTVIAAVVDRVDPAGSPGRNANEGK